MPLGLMALTAYLRRERDCVVRIFDMQHDCRGVDRVVDAARDFAPDLIGIGGMSTDAEVIHALAHRLKTAFPDRPLVVGGAHAGHRAEDLVALPDIDYVVAGEGEIATLALLDHLDGRIPVDRVPSLVRRTGDGIVRTDPAPPILDLDSLPFPAIDAIDADAYYRISRPGYFYARRRYAVVMTSRGCPFGCSYCHHIHGRKYRYRSPENVLAEMTMLRAKIGAQEFVFLDDLLNLPAGRLERIAELIIERDWGVALNMPTGLRGDLMSEQTLRLLKRAGLFRCMFAIDTASPRLQKFTGRRLNVEKTLEMIRFARKIGILVHGTFILGFPTETREEAELTVSTALGSDLHTAAFHRAVAFKGTKMYAQAVAAGAVNVDDPAGYDYKLDHGVNPSLMSEKELVRIRKNAWRRFYLSPRRAAALFAFLPYWVRVMPMFLRMWLEKAWSPATPRSAGAYTNA